MAMALSRRNTNIAKCIYTSFLTSSQNKPLHLFPRDVRMSQNGQLIIINSFLHTSPSCPSNSYSKSSPKLYAGSSIPIRNYMINASADSSSAASNLILYSYWQSSCSWRVRFALNLKGLAYEYRAVNLDKGEQLTPEFEKLNPLKYVPVLIDGDVVVSDSYAILLYLEEKYPGKPLLPTDPQLRAINLQVASIVSSSIQPLIMLSVLKYVENKVGREAQLPWAQTFLEKGFLALERLLHDIPGRYATGDEVYLADIFLAPQIIVGKARFNIDISKYPILWEIYKSCEALPAFQASLPEKQPDAQSR